MTQPVVAVGAFPPPVHGMAEINAQMRKYLQRRGMEVVSFNLSAGSLGRGWATRLRRMLAIGRAWVGFAALVIRRRPRSVYVGLSGGWGQVYEVCFVALARLFRVPTYLHHHSFAYLNEPALVTRLLVTVGGPRARHVVLSQRMGAALRKQYGEALSVRVVSNAALIDCGEADSLRERARLQVVGYLSNISYEKGAFVFVDVIKEVRARGVMVVGRIAGPFQDNRVGRDFLKSIAGLGFIEYVGPRYGSAKAAFLDSLDALVFPTRYKNEAEPLVIHEAMARGVPVLAVDRGCIREIVPAEAGFVLADGPDLVTRLVDELAAWAKGAQTLCSKAECARRAYHDLRDQERAALAALCEEIGAGGE